MMSEPCGGILTHNGDSYRVSSRRKDLAGTHLPSSRNDFSQISPSGQCDDTKEALRTDGNTIAWQAWDTARTLFGSHVNQAHHWCFQAKRRFFRAMYAQVGEEETSHFPSLHSHSADASMRGRKKRKQGEDNALVG